MGVKNWKTGVSVAARLGGGFLRKIQSIWGVAITNGTRLNNHSRG